jgi:hypothetical protein
MDDSLYDDPAVIRAGTAAFGLYARCGVYVARQLLDGFVPSELAAQWGTPEWIRKLTEAGLWEIVSGGFNMPRYLTDNPSRDKVLAERKMKAERQAKWLEKKRRVSRRTTNASSNGAIDGQKDVAQPPSLKGRKGGARASEASALRAPPAEKPPWCGSCDSNSRLIGDDNPARCPRCHPLATGIEADAWRASRTP